MEEVVFFKRHLPHYHHNTGTYFITFRLSNSLPTGISGKLKKEYEKEIDRIKKLISEEEKIKAENNCRKVYYDKFDRILNSCNTGELWLKDEKIASMIFNEIKSMDSNFVDNIAYYIMPNHVHMLIGLNFEEEGSQIDNHLQNIKQTKLSNLLKLLKGRTAREANLIWGRKGSFWHHESNDHIVRNEKEFYRIINYILMNPVKAG